MPSRRYGGCQRECIGVSPQRRRRCKRPPCWRLRAVGWTKKHRRPRAHRARFRWPSVSMALQAPICGKSLEGTRTQPDTQVASESSDDGHSPRRAVCNCHCHVTVRNVCLWCAIVFLARRAAQTSRPYRTRYVCAQNRPAKEETGKTSDAQPQPKDRCFNRHRHLWTFFQQHWWA